ncbi:hypothetical protein Clacol_010421 [Clathrus columnatus]|uniref:Uncharacterized protein n=1 Tax=Clathrus columnatus TaxID=1419009 RepID=A0AAV5ANB6_9AGAM|nr:hypothetical protein Clacol_010421 [Clathrus columnatus]
MPDYRLSVGNWGVPDSTRTVAPKRPSSDAKPARIARLFPHLFILTSEIIIIFRIITELLFTWGNSGVNGLHLQLDHIKDPTICPLDEIFTDHFMEGLFKHMRGAGEREDEDEDDTSMSTYKLLDTIAGEYSEHALAEQKSVAEGLFDEFLKHWQDNIFNGTQIHMMLENTNLHSAHDDIL